MARNNNRRRLKPLPIIITVIILAAIIVAAVILIKKLSPARTYTDFEYYYNLSGDSELGREAAREDELAIVLQQQNPDKLEGLILQSRAFSMDGQVYVKYRILKNNIDDRIYYDDVDNVAVITNALQMVTAELGEHGYSVDGNFVSTDYAVVTERDGDIYFAMDFIDEFSGASYEVFENPARVVIKHACGTIKTGEVSKNTQIRVKGGIKSNIVGDVEKGDELQIIEDLDDWLGVMSSEGYVGYIKANAVTNIQEAQAANDYDEPEYTSLTTPDHVRLGWLAVYTLDANIEFYELADNAPEMNVISPTWYFLANDEGGVWMLSDGSIVDAAHERGMLVWALFDDANTDYVEAVLSSTSKRKAVIDAVMEDMRLENIDGINIDFERIGLVNDLGDDFIEFLRELSIECRKAGKYLSVDNYAPYDYNACYHIEEQSRICDYVVVMAYDDYLGGADGIGPNSSLPFVKEVADLTVSKVEPSKTVIALPFYNRFWYEQTDGTFIQASYNTTKAWYLLELAGQSAAWDEELGLHYAEYDEDGERVHAWLESEDSYQAKLGLLEGYGIAGIAGWCLGQEIPELWDVIAQYY